MITPQEADQAAELMLISYCQACQVSTPDDVRKACEKMISKAARAIEKYNDTATAVAVLNRTELYIQTPGGQG